MPYPDLAEASAVVGALGAALALVAQGRTLLLAGLALTAVAGAGLAVALVPRDDLSRLGSPLAVSALVVAGVLAVVGAALFVRFPLVVPVALAVAAPFRVPVELGGQEAFLLVPLYCVLAAAGLAFVYRLLRGEEAVALPRPLALAAAAFVALSCVSLLWSRDVENGTVQLLFFLLPFATLVAIVARAPIADWLPRALAVAIVSLASVFAAIGLWQAATQRVFFAPDLEVANAYSTYFRVTSLFRDPSLYGRFLVIAIVVLLTALWLERVRLAVALPFIALLFAGLFFSYSQSSFATLFVMTAAVTFVLSDRRTRIIVAAACAVLALIAAGVVAWSATEVSLRELTSGRSRLVSITLPLAREHPLAGVGVGAQPLATNERLGLDPETRRTASHTTPATVAAELGALGVVAYVAFLAAAALTLLAAVRHERAFGLALSAVFTTIFVHSLVYAGFFEDPLVWGTLALAAAVPSARREPVQAVEPARAEPRPTPVPLAD